MQNIIVYGDFDFNESSIVAAGRPLKPNAYVKGDWAVKNGPDSSKYWTDPNAGTIGNELVRALWSEDGYVYVEYAVLDASGNCVRNRRGYVPAQALNRRVEQKAYAEWEAYAVQARADVYDSPAADKSAFGWIGNYEDLKVLNEEGNYYFIEYYPYGTQFKRGYVEKSKVTTTIYASGITLNQTSASLNVALNPTLQLTVAFEPEKTTERTITWSSSNDAVATVSGGRVTAKKAGTAVITATAPGGAKATCTITVTQPIEYLTISGRQILDIGETEDLDVLFTPADRAVDVIWWTTDPDVVSIDADTGAITAVGSGFATIHVATQEESYVAAEYVVMVRRRSIIIVPGVMGTELKLGADANGFAKGTVIWPPVMEGESLELLNNVLKSLSLLECDRNGKSLYNIQVKDGNYGARSTYQTLYDDLTRKLGDRYEIVFFGYDWRMPNDESGAKLASMIRQYDKAVVVAHSMGGLVASHMVKQGYRSKIQQLITLGTPFLGSLEMLPVMINGNLALIDEMVREEGVSEALIPFVSRIIKDKVQEVSVNIPSLYELLPNEKYFSLDGRCYCSYVLEFLPHLAQTYEETRSRLPAAIPEFNMNLFDAARARNNSLWTGSTHSTALVDTYYIAGEGLDTYDRFVFSHEAIITYQMTAELDGAGDGTVQSYSATMNDRYSEKTFSLE